MLLGQAAFVLGATLLVALLSGGILRASGRQTGRCVVELGLRAIKLSLGRGKLRRGLFALRIELGPPCGQLIGCAGGLGVDLRNGGLQLRRHIGKLSRARLLELRLKLAALRHGLVILRLSGIELGLRLRYGRLSLLALLCKLGRAAVMLRPAAGKLRFALGKLSLAAGELRCRGGKLSRSVIKLGARIVKLRLGIVHLRDGVCLLALELRTLIIKLCLSIALQLLDSRCRQPRGKVVQPLRHRVDALLIGAIGPCLASRPVDGEERFRIRIIGRKRPFGHEHEGRKLSRAKRGGAGIGSARVIRGPHETRDGKGTGGEHAIQVLRALKQLDGIADMNRGRPHVVNGKQALVIRFRPAALHQDGPVHVVVIVRSHMHAIVATARFRSINVKRMVAQRVLHARQLRYGIRLVGGHDARYAFDAAQHIDLLIGHPER